MLVPLLDTDLLRVLSGINSWCYLVSCRKNYREVLNICAVISKMPILTTQSLKRNGYINAIYADVSYKVNNNYLVDNKHKKISHLQNPF